MIFSVIVTAVILIVLAAACIRAVCISGGFGKGRRIRRLCMTPIRRPAEVRRSTYIKIFGAALAFRIFTYAVTPFVMYIIMGSTDRGIENILSHWQLWDARKYLNIAIYGYGSMMHDNQYLGLVFLPLYPWLIKLVDYIVGYPRISALIVSTFCYCISCCVIYRLTLLDYSKRAAKNTVIFLSIFPWSFFMGGIMNESTLLLMSSLCLYFIRTHKWLRAGIFGMLAALSRLVGVVLVFAYFAEWLEEYRVITALRQKRFKDFFMTIFKKGLFVLIIPFGTVIYLIINYICTGDPFAFLQYEETIWNQHSQFFGITLNTIWHYASDANKSLVTRYAIWIPQIFTISFCALNMLYGVNKTRTMYMGYLIPYLIINISASWPISGGRYMSAALPMFMIMGGCSEKYDTGAAAYIMISGILYGVFLVGFLMQRSII